MTKGEEENIFKVVRAYHPIPLAATYAHYRLSVQTESWRAFLEHIPPASFVHSLHLFHEMESSNMLKLQSLPIANLRFLQVLNLESSGPVRDFPEAISALVLLRFLAFYWAAKDIPPSILRLKNLGTHRILSGSKYCYNLPVAIWEMQKLRHLGIQSFGPEFRDDIPPLENVQSFCAVLIYFEEAEMLFRMIPTVRKSKCSVGMTSDQFLRLDSLSHLESLYLGHNSVELHRCPFHFPSTLKKLNMEAFRLPWTEISAISKLPNLEVLKLWNSFRGKIWNVEDEEFLKLKFFKLKTLEIEQLNASEESFPRLECLVVEDCPNLEENPPRFGSIFTLQMIQIKGCRFTLNSSVRQIQEEQVELGNKHLEVIISEVL